MSQANHGLDTSQGQTKGRSVHSSSQSNGEGNPDGTPETKSVTHRPSIFIAIVIVGCLVLGVVLVLFAIDIVPALIVSVILSCGVATLIYGILGWGVPSSVRSWATQVGR